MQNSVNNSLEKAFPYFQTNYYLYASSGTKLSEKASGHAQTIIDALPNVEHEKFNQLPLGVRVHILHKVQVEEHVTRLIDESVAGALIVHNIPASVKKICLERLITWDKDTGELKIHPTHLVDEDSIHALINSIDGGIRDTVKVLDVAGCAPITNLSQIVRSFSGVQHLKAKGLVAMKSLEGINEFKDTLEVLEADGLTKLTSLKGLDQCTRLKKVDLSQAPLLDDIRPLGHLKLLEDLDLSGCYNARFFPKVLPELEHLKRFSIEENRKFNNVSVLENCQKLEYLNISNTNVKDITPLNTIPGLTRDTIKALNCAIPQSGSPQSNSRATS